MSDRDEAFIREGQLKPIRDTEILCYLICFRMIQQLDDLLLAKLYSLAYRPQKGYETLLGSACEVNECFLYVACWDCHHHFTILLAQALEEGFRPKKKYMWMR